MPDNTTADIPTVIPANDQAKGLIVPEYAFLTDSRYSSNTFMGILVDTGASEYSMAGYAQYLAYRKTVKGTILDQATAGQAKVQFGPGDLVTSIGTIDVETPVGAIRFHVIETITPFLLSLKDMDELGIYFDNTRDTLICREPHLTASITRRFGHPFLVWDYSLQSYLTESFDTEACFLTETELRCLHRRFGHPLVEKLRKLLERAGYNVNTEALKHIRKVCYYC
jgi:hypothetical protein